MSTLQRLTYEDRKGFIVNEWFPTPGVMEARCIELTEAGITSFNREEIEVPWDHLADLIYWLNHNPNSPNIKEGSMHNVAVHHRDDHQGLEWPEVPTPESTSALDVQVAGDHYKKLTIQPVEYMHANGIPFMEGCAIKYLTRWRDKGGIKDLEKAKHFIELLIELEQRATKKE